MRVLSGRGSGSRSSGLLGSTMRNCVVSSRRSASTALCALRRSNHGVGAVNNVRAEASSSSLNRGDEVTTQQRQGQGSSGSGGGGGGRSIEELKSEMKKLQEQIHAAHLQAHLQEQRVAEALENLEDVDERSRSLEASLFDAAAEASVAPAVEEEKKAHADLRSDLSWPKELVDFWHPVEFSKNVTEEPTTFDILNFPLAVFRNGDTGVAECRIDEASALASTSQCQKQKQRQGGIQIKEKDGLVWVWLSEKEAPEDIPGFTVPPEPFHEDSKFTIHAELVIDVDVEHGLLMENLLDLAHAPFTHTQTFAKGWSIPDLVKFKTSKLLGGNWEPYPIDMSFEPPYMVLSTIGLMQPGKLEEGARAAACQNHLHQLHVCLPSSKGTRLLYRMSLDFMDFMLYVPFAKKIWEAMAAQVLGEDLRLVQGQEDRLKRGGDTWANPVPYDKLAVRYRKWRNSLHCETKRSEAEEALREMSAGEMLAPEENDGFSSKRSRSLE